MHAALFSKLSVLREPFAKAMAAAALMVFTGANAHANQKLLECNMPSGDEQEIIVESGSDGLILKELSDAGLWQSRPLSREEWQSGSLKLKPRAGTGEISRSADGWWYDFKAGSFRVMGFADCF